MGQLLRAAVIVALAMVAATAIYVYQSPYQSCIRALAAEQTPEGTPVYPVGYPQWWCANLQAAER